MCVGVTIGTVSGIGLGRVVTRDISTGVILGSCYIPKKSILYITTGDVRVDAGPDRFETNICLLRRVKKIGN